MMEPWGTPQRRDAGAEQRPPIIATVDQPGHRWPEPLKSGPKYTDMLGGQPCPRLLRSSSTTIGGIPIMTHMIDSKDRVSHWSKTLFFLRCWLVCKKRSNLWWKRETGQGTWVNEKINGTKSSSWMLRAMIEDTSWDFSSFRALC